MEDIYIFGSGGFAREVFYLIQDIGNYHFKAFVEKSISATSLLLSGNDYPIISEKEFSDICDKKSDVNAVIAIASSSIVSCIVLNFGHVCSFPNLVHPSAKILGNLQMGIGNIVSWSCFFSDNVSVGSFNRFNVGNIVGHDVTVGDNNHLNPSCNISGNVTIADNNFFGVKATVLQGIRIGSSNTIGASSLVLKKINDGGTYFGIPAIKMNF